MLFSMTGDSGGHHDTLAGFGDAATTPAKFGAGPLPRPAQRLPPQRADNFVVALGRHGLDRRDLVHTFNLFAGVRVGPEGALDWIEGCGGRAPPSTCAPR